MAKKSLSRQKQFDSKVAFWFAILLAALGVVYVWKSLASGRVTRFTLSTAAGDDHIILSWDQPETASHYRIYRDGKLQTTVTGQHYSDRRVADGSCYDYQAEALNSSNSVIGKSAIVSSCL